MPPLQAYKSLVRPHVEYCTPVWSPCYQKDKILRVQHRFTRMIPGFSKLHTVKDLNVWDSGVWRKDVTEPTSLKYLRWLKNSLEYQWNLCLNCPPQSTSEVMNWSWLNTGVKISETAFLYGTTSQQMEQFKSSHSDCKYREHVSRMVCSDWNNIGWVSSRTEVRLTLWLHKCFNKTGVATPGKWPGKYVWDLSRISRPVSRMNVDICTVIYTPFRLGAGV